MTRTGPVQSQSIERLVLQPFFARLRDGVHGQIRDSLAVPPGNGYTAGRLETQDGLQLTVSAARAGDDQYASTFSVRFEHGAEAVRLHLRGHVALYRHVRRELGPCTAQAEESLELHWSGTFRIAPATDPAGHPALTVTPDLRVDRATHDREENDCARAFGRASTAGSAARLAALPRLELPLPAERGRVLVTLSAPAHPADGG